MEPTCIWYSHNLLKKNVVIRCGIAAVIVTIIIIIETTFKWWQPILCTYLTFTFFYLFCLPDLNTFEKLYFFLFYSTLQLFCSLSFFIKIIRSDLFYYTSLNENGGFSWQHFSRCLLRPSLAISRFLIGNFKPKSLLNSREIICTNSGIHTKSNNWHYLCLFSCLCDIVFVSTNLCLIYCDRHLLFGNLCKGIWLINFSY